MTCSGGISSDTVPIARIARLRQLFAGRGRLLERLNLGAAREAVEEDP